MTSQKPIEPMLLSYKRPEIKEAVQKPDTSEVLYCCHFYSTERTYLAHSGTKASRNLNSVPVT